ncbi:fumarylacetoacetate hydrolase family protein [Jatrophihabitans fulvus]
MDDVDDADVAWGVIRGDEVVPLPGRYDGIAEVLSAGVAAARAMGHTEPGVPVDSVRVCNPLPGARVFCQGANYPAHLAETGMSADRAFNLMFTKSSGSLTGPHEAVVRPPHVRLLDYEIELGLVVGTRITAPVTVTEADLPDYVAAFVVANDVSARDVQLTQGQFYKGKSYRTFCPVGPYLCVPDRDEVSRWRELRLTLSVNGRLRQDARAGEMVFDPAATLTEASELENFEPGDLVLTGTPGGVALAPPPAIVQRIGALLPEPTKWSIFVKRQLRNPNYLQPGDRLEAAIRTDDGALDLGVQTNVVR